MKHQTKHFLPHHTHFIGVQLPDEISDTVFDCREWMRGTYGCKSGHGTPPHITLLAPFTLPEGFSDNDVFEATQRAIEECKNQNVFPFDVKLSGFGSFSERTLYINVIDSDAWQKMHAIFQKVFSEEILSSQKKDTRRFYPHLSIANRDIPPGVMDEALKHFAELNLNEIFTANEITVYIRTPTGGWCNGHNIA